MNLPAHFSYAKADAMGITTTGGAAQVYAQEHPELKAELDAFAFAKPDKPRRKKRDVEPTQKQGRHAAERATRDEATADT